MALALALFDVDGTLVAGPSTEKRLFWMLLAAGRLGPAQLGAFLATGLRGAAPHGWKGNKAYLKGLPRADVAGLAAAWVARAAAGWWFAPCVERLRRHQAAGDRVVLLSGTPQFVADPLARLLGAESAVGTLCASEGSHFAAGPPVRHPFGAAKLALAREICAASGAAPSQVVAYGDSVHDLPLLHFAGRAVAVRPDAGLAAAARAAGWEILGRR